MKQPLVVSILIASGIALALIAPAAAAGEAADERAAEADDPILAAYLADPEVVRAIEQYLRQGLVDDGPRSNPIHGMCGVAGCSYAYLVVHPFASGGTNPQTRSILARVSGMHPMVPPKVELVELTPKSTPGDPPGRPPCIERHPEPGSAPRGQPREEGP